MTIKPKINVRGKGSAGEREICDILSARLNLKTKLTRNLEQTRYGGADIMTLKPFAIEVKRQQNLQINDWLRQAVSQVTKKNHIPVLIYRQNKQKWAVMIPFNTVANKKLGKVHSDHFVTISLDLFVEVCKPLISLHKK